jgi:hypothetical protein
MDIFETTTLTRVVAYLPVDAITFLVDRYFTDEQRSQVEEIRFDVQVGKRRIAPFVSPLVQGKIVEELGYKTNLFKPAYVKPKTVFDVNRPFKRAIGENIGGTMSPQERMDRAVAATLLDHIQMIQRRMEVMASEVIRTGKITVSGELYPTQVVDFGRDSSLTVVLGSGSKWSDAGIKPLDNLDTWAGRILTQSGSSPVDVIMGPDVWAVFRSDADVLKQLDRFRGTVVLDVSDKTPQGAQFKGQINMYNFWTYAGTYVDENDATQQLWPAGTVAMLGPQLEGVRAYGAIRDERAGFMPLPYYPTSWLENDPPLRYLMTQSAPLLVPYRPNASLAATVL